MNTIVEGPGPTISGLRKSSWDGEIDDARPCFNAIPPRICTGNWMMGRAWRTPSFSEDCTSTKRPERKLAGTPKSLEIFTCISLPPTPSGFFVRVHPESCNALSICLRRFTDSESENTPRNVYSVPLNACRDDISVEALVSDLGDLSRFSSAVASTACCLADTISFSNESASRLAALARVKAFDAEDVALSDCSFARCAAIAASVAEAFASPASFKSSDTRSSLAFLISVSTLPAWTSMYNSPATPTETRPAPSNPNTSRNALGFSGGCTIPRRKSCKSSTYSQTTKTTSSATPTTTRNVQKCSQPWSEERDISRLSSSILRADSSIKELRDDQVLKLLAFRGLPHDPQGVLTAVCQLALVSIKLRLNVGVWRRKAGLELGIAPLAYADGWGWGFRYDTQASVRHNRSLSHSDGSGWPVEIKRHHYQKP